MFEYLSLGNWPLYMLLSAFSQKNVKKGIKAAAKQLICTERQLYIDAMKEAKTAARNGVTVTGKEVKG